MSVSKAYVVLQDDSTFTIVSEHDKKIHILNQPVVQGDYTLPDGKVVNIQPIIFDSSRLFSACREYAYDVERKVRYYTRKKSENEQKKKEKEQKKEKIIEMFGAKPAMTEDEKKKIKKEKLLEMFGAKPATTEEPKKRKRPVVAPSLASSVNYII